jgi:hypothetical protein
MEHALTTGRRPSGLASAAGEPARQSHTDRDGTDGSVRQVGTPRSGSRGGRYRPVGAAAEVGGFRLVCDKWSGSGGSVELPALHGGNRIALYHLHLREISEAGRLRDRCLFHAPGSDFNPVPVAAVQSELTPKHHARASFSRRVHAPVSHCADLASHTFALVAGKPSAHPAQARSCHGNGPRAVRLHGRY